MSVNGHFTRDLATRVGPLDEVRVAGLPQRRPAPPQVVALHKPKGLLCTRRDERGRPTIYTLLPKKFQNFAYVGRLDRDSEGLLLLTNDGALAERLARPRSKMEKEYLVTLDAPLDPAAIPKLLRGIMIPGGRARAERVELSGEKSVRIVLTQGLKRQLREMFYRVGREVRRLTRVRIGPITLDGLVPGSWRLLAPGEIAALSMPALSQAKSR